MKFVISILVLLFAWPGQANSQSDSIPIGRVVYARTVDLPGTPSMRLNGKTSLLFNSVRSLFIHHGAFAGDTSYQDDQYVFPVHIKGDSEGFPIYKLHQERRMLSKFSCRQSDAHCIVSDTLGHINWKLHSDQKDFGPYTCQKATGVFRGREYEAWYALDIPIPSGPHKLGGLPGLILEARSLDGVVEYRFAGIEISNRMKGILQPPSGTHLGISYTEYMDSEKQFFENLEKEARASGINTTISFLPDIELSWER
ncbi:MAG: GLPGLI family protein [Saprospiraceae bacterium]